MSVTAIPVTMWSTTDVAEADACSTTQELIETHALASASLQGDDPTNALQFISLLGVACYPQPDKVPVCAGADTLAFLLYSKSETPIGPITLGVDFGPGLEYGGFAQVTSGNAQLIIRCVFVRLVYPFSRFEECFVEFGFWSVRFRLVVVFPFNHRRKRHKNGLGTTITLQAEVGAAIPNEVKLDVTASPIQLKFAFAISIGGLGSPLYDL